MSDKEPTERKRRATKLSLPNIKLPYANQITNPREQRQAGTIKQNTTPRQGHQQDQ